MASRLATRAGSVATPTNGRGRVLLHFGAADWLARVWVNGKPVGWHRGGHVPFSFDIADSLKRGDNMHTISAKDERRVSWRNPRRGLPVSRLEQMQLCHR